jgi:hypothetical protein
MVPLSTIKLTEGLMDRIQRRQLFYEIYGIRKAMILSDYNLKHCTKPKLKIPNFEYDNEQFVQWLSTGQIMIFKDYIGTYERYMVTSKDKSFSIAHPKARKVGGSIVLFKGKRLEITNKALGDVLNDIWNELFGENFYDKN